MEGRYAGSCHCNNVRFETTLALREVISCNCSICSRTGALLAFVPAERFRLLAGEESLAHYQFGKKQIDHIFCSNCGIRPFSTGRGPGGEQMVAINVRCLEGVDLDSLQVRKVDGRSL